MRTEPLITTASLTALAVALIALLVSFGIPLTDDQQKAILGVVAFAAPFIVAAASRSKVTPSAKVVEYAEGSRVIAGEANDHLPETAVVRELGADGVDDTPRRALDGVADEADVEDAIMDALDSAIQVGLIDAAGGGPDTIEIAARIQGKLRERGLLAPQD